MRKVIIQSIVGLILIVISIGIVYLSLSKFIPSFALALAVVLSMIGIFFLYKAGTTDVYKMKFEEIGTVPTPDSESLLKKNSQMVTDYYKTVESRDKLKILKMSDDATGKS